MNQTTKAVIEGVATAIIAAAITLVVFVGLFYIMYLLRSGGNL